MRVPDIKTVEWIAGVDAVDALMPTFHTQTLEQGFAVIRGLVAPDRVDEVAVTSVPYARTWDGCRQTVADFKQGRA